MIAKAPPPITWQPWTNAMTSEPSVSIQHTAQVIVNALADSLLGNPSFVQILYCREPQMIGFRAADSDGPGIIRVQRKKDGSFQFGCRAFLDYHGIAYIATRRWRARMVDGVLAVDMTAEPLKSRRTKES